MNLPPERKILIYLLNVKDSNVILPTGFPDISSSQQEVESHTSMAQSFKRDQARAQESISLLNTEQHCLGGVVSWMVLVSLRHDIWRSKKVIECRGTAQKALFLHLKVSAQFPKPCPTPLGKGA